MKIRVMTIMLLLVLNLIMASESISAMAETSFDKSATSTVQDYLGTEISNVEIDNVDSLGANDFSTASLISLGGTVNGSITQTARDRIYKFTLNQSGRIDLTMTSYMQYYCIYLYDNTGSLIWYISDKEWNTNLKYRSDSYFTDLTAGTYYMKINGYKYSSSTIYDSTGTYIFSTKFTNAGETYREPNNDFSQASVITLNSAVKGQIADNDPYDIYKFYLKTSGKIKLDLTSYMQYYSIFIYDNTGSLIWYTNENEWNSNLKYRSDTYNIDITAGTYYMRVDGYKYRYSTSYYSTGTYLFSTKFIDAGVTYIEPNNDFSTAYVAKTDTPIKGQIAINDQHDILKFTLSKDMDVQISMASYMPYYCLYIYNMNGYEIWKTEENVSNENVGYRKDNYVVTLSAGTYYMKVTGYKWGTDYPSTGTYTLSINTKTSIADAIIVSINDKSYTGKSIKPAAVLYYNGVKLKNGVDYTLSYKNNKNIGTATITVTGKGDYTGTKSIAFKIVPKKSAITKAKNNSKKAVTLTWKKDSSASGYEIYRSTNKNSGYKKVTAIKNAKTTTYKNTNLIKGTTYHYKIRAYKVVSGKKYYGNFSKTKFVTITK